MPPKPKKASRTIVESDDEEWDGTEVIQRKQADQGVADTLNDTDESDYSAGDSEDDESDDDDGFLVDSDEDSDESKGKRKRKIAKSVRAKPVAKDARKPPLPLSSTLPSGPPKTPSTNHLRNFSLSSPAASSPSTSVSNTPMTQGSNDESFPSQLSQGASPSPVVAYHLLLPEGVVGPGSHEHNSFEFLKPANRKDKSGRKMNHPEYNPRTVVSKHMLYQISIQIILIFIIDPVLSFSIACS